MAGPTTIHQGLGRLIAIFAAVLLVATLAGGWAMTSAFDARRAASRARESALAVTELTVAFGDMETGQRGFVITGDDAFLQPYTEGEASSRRLIATLENWFEDDPSHQQQLGAVEQAAVTWEREAAEPEIEARRSSAESALELVSSGTGKQYFDDLRTAIAVLAGALDDDTDAAVEHEQSSWSTLTGLVVASMIVALVVLGLVAWFVRVRLKPLDELVDAVRQVRAGDTTTTVATSATGDVRELAEAVEEMRGRLNAGVLEAVRAREAVEQSAVVVLQLGAELATDLGEYPDGWSVAAGLQPAEGLVAGDCYDAVLVSPRRIGVVVIDIAGHGAVTAIDALKAKLVLIGALRSGMNPGKALRVLFDQFDDSRSGFLTAFVAVVDTESGRCQYANAGHPPAMLTTAAGTSLDLGSTGPLLGPLEATWTTDSVVLEPGAKLVVYTDGLTEARGPDGDFYGAPRLTDLITSTGDVAADAVVDTALDDLRSFAGDRQRDDVTILVVSRHDRPADPEPEPEPEPEPATVAASAP